jgi:hypothetical protein
MLEGDSVIYVLLTDVRKEGGQLIKQEDYSLWH